MTIPMQYSLALTTLVLVIANLALVLGWWTP